MLTSFLSDAMERCMIVRTKAPEAILTRFDANRAGLKEDYIMSLPVERENSRSQLYYNL